MKKVFFLLAVAGMFSFAACNNAKTTEPTTEEATEMTEATPEETIDTTATVEEPVETETVVAE